MKKTLIASVILMMFCALAASAQKTVAPYTVSVYPVTNIATGAIGSIITSNSQIAANAVYQVFVRSNHNPVPIAIWVDNADGFDIGCLCGGPGTYTFQPYSTPTAASGDVGSNNNYTIKFHIRTFSGVNFSVPLYMRIQQTLLTAPDPASANKTQLIRFTFPY